MSPEKRPLICFRCLSMLIGWFVLSSAVYAQATDTIYLWPDKVPGEFDEKHPPVRSDKTQGNVIRLTDITNPALLVYEPLQLNRSGVGIIICPGGSYKILSMDKEGLEVAEWLNGLGYVAFVLQYRVPNKEYGALQDIQRAIRLVRDRSALYQIDPGKVGVLGFSAGGSLCARASTCYNENTYVKVDHIEKESCRPDFSILIYPAYLDRGLNRKLSPELSMQERTPPFFIFGTSDDSHGNSSLVMTTALRDEGIPVELHLLPEGGHGYGLRSGNIAAETWPFLAENWLKRYYMKEAL